MSLPMAVQPRDLRQAGWGVVYDPVELERAGQGLQKLLAFREEQAGGHFKLWPYEGQAPRQYLFETLGVTPGTIASKEMPYYLLLVGSPERIPFAVQTALAVDFAVGRLHFENAEHYGHYAESVIQAEKHGVARPRRLDLFAAPKEPDDPTSKRMVDFIVEPLSEHLKNHETGWQVQTRLGEDEAWWKLLRLFRGTDTPGLLLTACHGQRFAFGHEQQKALQGSLSVPGGFIAASHLVDLPLDDKKLHGMIAFLFGNYSAGTPVVDGKSAVEILGGKPETTQPNILAEHDFSARLPEALLANGALAVVGQIDRGWTSSLRWLSEPQAPNTALALEICFLRLLKGERLGYALRPLADRFSALVLKLANMLEAQASGLKSKTSSLHAIRAALQEARSYIVLGDPAVYALGRPTASHPKGEVNAFDQADQEHLIEQLPPPADPSMSFYSCFISYSHEDKNFARLLYKELKTRGIRCWLDEHQLLPGDDIYDMVDRGIRLWDKVLLCCSEASLNSWWVEDEIGKALEKERRLRRERNEKILAIIPLNLDDYLFKGWKSAKATAIRDRLAADFTDWEDNNSSFEEQLERVVRALRTQDGGREKPPERKI